MTDLQGNSSNSSRREWRKLVKKLRRKRIRRNSAMMREKHRATVFQTDSDESDRIEDSDSDEEEQRQQRHREWLRVEEEAQKKWQEKKLLHAQKEKEKQLVQERIRREWDTARKQKLEKKKAEESKQLELNEKIENFLNDGGSIPQELTSLKETNPGKGPCPFFSKVAACRFGATCSRNHVLPGISKTLLIPNFYAHFTLYQARSAEYDTDVGLEFEETEMDRDFREFFNDTVNEFERLGELRVMQVCKNSGPHLRGNVYVEYRDERGALAAMRALNARWYAGRQLTVQFALVPDWGAAICGDFHRGRCPKGNDCNFLHTFRNPRGLLVPRQQQKDSSEGPSRSWRWSESPERTTDHNGTSRSRSRESHSRKEKSPSRSHRRQSRRSRSSSKNSHSRSSSRDRIRHHRNREKSNNLTKEEYKITRRRHGSKSPRSLVTAI